ncbi:MAG: hypothetical protein ACQEQL_05900 [Pseudomonadota bacterium]
MTQAAQAQNEAQTQAQTAYDATRQKRAAEDSVLSKPTYNGVRQALLRSVFSGDSFQENFRQQFMRAVFKQEKKIRLPFDDITFTEQDMAFNEMVKNIKETYPIINKVNIEAPLASGINSNKTTVVFNLKP